MQILDQVTCKQNIVNVQCFTWGFTDHDLFCSSHDPVHL